MKPKPIPGAENAPRGAVNKWHVGNISGQASRGFNAIEMAGVTDTYESLLEDAIEDVRKHYSTKFLKYFRELVAQYKTHNHEIVFQCGMGLCSILINNTLLQYFPSRGIFALLYEIEQTMDWGWGSYLDGEKLN